MTYNICAKCNRGADYKEVVDAVKNIKPDICGLQEVDSMTVNSQLEVAKLIADSTLKEFEYHSLYKFASGGGIGDAMLYDFQPDSTKIFYKDVNDHDSNSSEIEIN